MTLNEPSKQQTHEERTTGKLLTDSYGKNVECELVSEPVRARQIWASPCAHRSRRREAKRVAPLPADRGAQAGHARGDVVPDELAGGYCLHSLAAPGF